MDELIKRIRSETVYLPEKFSKNAELLDVLMKAADAIEQLTADLERSKEWETFWEKEANEALKKFQTAVANKPRWIPVAERLPSDRAEVLVSSGIFAPLIEVAFYDGLFYSAWDGKTEIAAVTHWMPLPEPPKEE